MEGRLLLKTWYISEAYLGLQCLLLNLYYRWWQTIKIIAKFVSFPIQCLLDITVSLIAYNLKTTEGFSKWPFCFGTSAHLCLVKIGQHWFKKNGFYIPLAVCVENKQTFPSPGISYVFMCFLFSDWKITRGSKLLPWKVS